MTSFVEGDTAFGSGLIEVQKFEKQVLFFLINIFFIIVSLTFIYSSISEHWEI